MWMTELHKFVTAGPCAVFDPFSGALFGAGSCLGVTHVSLQPSLLRVELGRSHQKAPGESGLVSRGSQGLRSPLESRRGSLGAP